MLRKILFAYGAGYLFRRFTRGRGSAMSPGYSRFGRGARW
jgi:hypothetical protein